MCGIAGAMVLDGAPALLSEDYLAALSEPMRHRGPDGAGLWLAEDRRVGFSHRRLSIVDLSEAAAQPMSDSAGEIWLTYNGEIYNHGALRRELEALGHRFRTDHCDTEVIIHSYRQWGTDCVHRFRGMFAFGLWDGRERRLWLVRDRLGVKPLYYTARGGRLVFASEIKALLTDPAQPRAINEEAFFHYLSFLATPAPDTLFAGIRKLAAGTMLVAAPSGDRREERYWDALAAATEVEGGDEDIAERVLAELRTSVRLRKMSDVPVGIFLSGGVDSSTIAALFSEGEAKPVQSFSIGYDRDYPSYRSELGYARQAAEHVGAEHHEFTMSRADLAAFLPRMVELQDEPIADPVCVPLYYLAKRARAHGVVVAQVGEGADELFWGYPGWKRALGLQRLAELFPVPAPFQRAALAGLRAAGKERTQPYDWLDRAARDLPIFWGGAEAFSAADKLALLSPRLRRQFQGRSSWEAIRPIYDRYRALERPCSPLAWMTYLDLNFRLPELLLMRVDKMTMGASLEARTPFLDSELVALALGIPESVKTRGGILKTVLKRAVRGIIPDAIIDRPKQGFGVPVWEWLNPELLRGFMPAVEAFIAETDLLDPDAARSLFSDPRRAGMSWPILNVALWWDRFVRRGPEAMPSHSPATSKASRAVGGARG
jgi:asparagine synthase (glutamine-hydrolysing)